MWPVPFNSARAFVALGSWRVEGTKYVCRQGLLRMDLLLTAVGVAKRGRISSRSSFYNGRHVTPRGCWYSVKQDHQFLNKISTTNSSWTIMSKNLNPYFSYGPESSPITFVVTPPLSLRLLRSKKKQQKGLDPRGRPTYGASHRNLFLQRIFVPRYETRALCQRLKRYLAVATEI